MATKRSRSAGLVLAAIVSGVGVGLSGGCAPNASHVDITGADSVQTWTVCAVDVENYAGEVTVWVDPTLQQPVIRCEKLVPGTAPSTHVSTQVAATTSAVVSQADGRLVLRVTTRREEESQAELVHLSVRVPSCDGLRIRNTGGMVRVEEVGGALDILNIGGINRLSPDVIVRTDREIVAPVSIISNGGGFVELSMSSESAGRLDLQGPRGFVEVKAERGRLESVRTDGITFTGVLNRGEHSMKLRSDRGGVLVRLVKETQPSPELAATSAPAPTGGGTATQE